MADLEASASIGGAVFIRFSGILTCPYRDRLPPDPTSSTSNKATRLSFEESRLYARPGRLGSNKQSTETSRSRRHSIIVMATSLGISRLHGITATPCVHGRRMRHAHSACHVIPRSCMGRCLTGTARSYLQDIGQNICLYAIMLCLSIIPEVEHPPQCPFMGVKGQQNPLQDWLRQLSHKSLPLNPCALPPRSSIRYPSLCQLLHLLCRGGKGSSSSPCAELPYLWVQPRTDADTCQDLPEPWLQVWIIGHHLSTA